MPGGAAPGPGFDAGAHLRQLADAYVAFGRGVLALLGSGAEGGAGEALAGAFERWAKGDRSREAYDSLRDFFSAAPAGLASAFAALGERGLDERVGNTLSAWADELLALPAVGPQRDWQAAAQRLARELLEQQRAAAVVGRHHEAALRMAYARYAAFLRAPDGPPISSLAALYDSWVEIAETAYAETVSSPAFASDFAAWINTASRARMHGNALRERQAAQLDLPQRGEINALLARQRALEAEVSRLQDALAAAREQRETMAVERVASPPPVLTQEQPAEPAQPLQASAPPSVSPATPRPVAATTRRKAPAAKAPKAAKVPASKRVPARPAAAARATPRARAGTEFDIGDILARGE